MTPPLDHRWTKRVIDRLDIAHNGRLTAWLREGQAEAMVALWAEKLGGLDADSIKRGLGTAERMERPPTPDQFRALCGRPPAYEPYRVLPSPVVAPEQAERNRAELREAAKLRAMRRCLYRPGYGRAEHAKAIEAVRAAGLPTYVADMRAMACHGWCEEFEAAHRRAWMALPGGHRLVCPERKPDRLALYPPGHEPPDWVIHTTDYARVDEWIKTGELAPQGQAA